MQRSTLCLLLSPLLLWSCDRPVEPEPQPRDEVRRDLLLIPIDTLRPDFLSCYGYPRESTPAIDKLAASGALFESCYTASPMTGPSHATMLTGLYPTEHGLERNGLTLDPAVPRLSEVLQEAGYNTGAVLGAKVIDRRFAFDQGFDFFDDQLGTAPGSAQRAAREVVDRSIAAIGKSGDAPLFLWVHLYDPHSPNETPHPSAEWTEAGVPMLAERLVANSKFGQRQLIDLALDYEAEILAMNSHLERLLEAWDSSPRQRAGVVCLTSDHGENFGNHDYVGHGKFLWEEQLRVPLILRNTGQIQPGLRPSGGVSLVDLPGTLLKLCAPGLESPLGGLDFVDMLDGGTAPRDMLVAERPPIPQISESRNRANQSGVDVHRGDERAVLLDGWKYIWRDDLDAQLFNIAVDSREAVSVDDPQRIADFERIHGDWLESLSHVGQGERVSGRQTQQMLEALGYK